MRTRIALSRLSLTAGASASIALLSITACAAASAAFNPDSLAQPQLEHVAQVCQNVMGLSPDERLVGGQWLGDSHLDYWTSRYRGCVTSLSDSFLKSRETALTDQADHDCRAKGYASGSSDLALCVLKSAQQPSASLAPGLTSNAEVIPAVSGSLFYASGAERARREQLACAAMGIEPNGEAFNTCVRNLQGTFHAIDTPIS